MRMQLLLHIGFFSVTWLFLVYTCRFSCCFFYSFYVFLWRRCYARNVRPRVFYSVSSVYTNFIYFDLYQNMAGRLELVETVYIMIPNACLLDKMHVGFWCSRFRCFWFLWCLLVVGIKRIIFPMSQSFGKKRSKP